MNLVFDTSGVEYINLCLNGLGIDCQYLYKSDLFFIIPYVIFFSLSLNHILMKWIQRHCIKHY